MFTSPLGSYPQGTNKNNIGSNDNYNNNKSYNNKGNSEKCISFTKALA